MLTDSEIVSIRHAPNYRSLTSVGFKGIVSDLVQAGHVDLRQDVSTALKVLHTFTKSRLIRLELARATCLLLERLLNRQLNWERSPASVRNICDASEERYLWMRYDSPRVNALFHRSVELVTDAEFRHLVKQYSSLTEPQKDERLTRIRLELEQLGRATIRSIETRGIFDHFVEYTKDEFYQQNESQIQKAMLKAGQSGVLSEPTLPRLGEGDGKS